MNHHCNQHENISNSKDWQFSWKQQYSPCGLECNKYATDSGLCPNSSSI